MELERQLAKDEAARAMESVRGEPLQTYCQPNSHCSRRWSAMVDRATSRRTSRFHGRVSPCCGLLTRPQ
jgi:hypothetical protein